MRVMIDPGHGGTDSGASHNGILEKDLNLEVAQILKNLLNAQNIDAEMTRSQDVDVTLESRCQQSNLYYADLFVSIHHNAGSGRGYEIYHYTRSEEGERLANLVASEFDKIQTKRYVGSGLYAGTKKGDYYVLKNTNCPAILTEFCFIDNDDDFASYNARKQAEAIANGIFKYFGIEVKEEPVSKHWAEGHFLSLARKGYVINERRFNDYITRGEIFALLDKKHE